MSFNKELVAGIHSQLCDVARDIAELALISNDISFIDYVDGKIYSPIVRPWEYNSDDERAAKDSVEGRYPDTHALVMAAAYAFSLTSEGREKTAEGIKDLFARKNHDYGDAYATARNDIYQYFAGKIYDKLRRYMTLAAGAEAQVAESIDDTLKDLGNYCLMEAAHIIADKVESLGDFGMSVYNGFVCKAYSDYIFSEMEDELG